MTVRDNSQCGKPHTPEIQLDSVGAEILFNMMADLRRETFPPISVRTMRQFSLQETAKLFGLSDDSMRQMAHRGHVTIGTKDGRSGRLSFSANDFASFWHYLETTSQPHRPIRSQSEALQTIAFANSKSGSGKTTSSVHFAQYMALRGHRVLAIDVDFRAIFSRFHGYIPEFDVDDRATLYGAVCDRDKGRRPMHALIRKSHIPGLDIVPGGAELIELEHCFHRFEDQQDPFPFRLRDAISQVSDDYDIVVFDCPPRLSYLTLSVLCTSTSTVIVTQAQMRDLASMSEFLKMRSDRINLFTKRGIAAPYNWTRYLITRYEPTDGPQQLLAAHFRSIFKSRVLINSILKSTAISDAALTYQSLYEIGRGQFAKSTYEPAIESFNRVNSELETLVHRIWGRTSCDAKAFSESDDNAEKVLS